MTYIRFYDFVTGNFLTGVEQDHVPVEREEVMLPTDSTYPDDLRTVARRVAICGAVGRKQHVRIELNPPLRDSLPDRA